MLSVSSILFCAVLIRSCNCGFLTKNNFINQDLRSLYNKEYKEHWFTQRQDHENPRNLNTYQQRYFMSDTNFKPGGPIFISIGGEGPISAPWLDYGLMADIAKEVGAVVYILEHRYYGKSHPVNNTAVNNLKYLSSSQALQDLAHFIQNVSSQLSYDAKCIVFGGSYPGSLAMWSILKYPHLIDGSVSSSSPLVALPDFYKYLEVVQNSVKNYGGEECYSNINNAIQNTAKLLSSIAGKEQLKSIYSLCAYLKPNGEDDANFMQFVIGIVEGVVQYSGDNRAFEGASFVDIGTLCNIMNNSTIGTPIERYAKAAVVIYHEEDCADVNYQENVFAMRNVSWESELLSSRSWVYQTCTEFGWYQTTDSYKVSWGNINMTFEYHYCRDVYGMEFNKALLDKGIAQTNEDYGGLDIVKNLRRTVLFNGGVDPWHAVSYVPQETKDFKTTRKTQSNNNMNIYKFKKETLSNKIQFLNRHFINDKFQAHFEQSNISDPNDFHAIFVPSSAHCAVLYPAKKDDDPLLTKARETVTYLVKEWIKN